MANASNLGMENILRDVHDPVLQTLRVTASISTAGFATETKQDTQITTAQSTNTKLDSIIANTNDAATETTLATIAAVDFATESTLGGLLTDSQLRATPVPVSGTVTANAGTGTMAISAVSLPLPTGAATGATQSAQSIQLSDISIYTGNTAANTLSIDGKITTVDTSNVTVISTTGLTDTQLRATPVPISGTVTANAGTGTMSISAAALPLPTGAATETTLAAFSGKSAAGLVPEKFDEQVIAYVGATTDISAVTYKLATVTVATLTMSYDGSNRLTGVVRT